VGDVIISTNFVEKPKRGRPPIIPPEIRAAIRSLWGNGCTSRAGLQNGWYYGKAIKALLDHPDGQEAAQAAYRYLVDFNSNDVKSKRTILAELGRVGDPHMIRQLAEVICMEEFSTEEAVRRLRLYRRYLREAQLEEAPQKA
jgi:hypothetical protein